MTSDYIPERPSDENPADAPDEPAPQPNVETNVETNVEPSTEPEDQPDADDAEGTDDPDPNAAGRPADAPVEGTGGESQ